MGAVAAPQGEGRKTVKINEKGAITNMIALGQLLAEGRMRMKMDPKKAAEKILESSGIKISFMMIRRIEKGEKLKIQPELLDALIGLYKLRESDVYMALHKSGGTSGIKHFVIDAIDVGMIKQAITALQTLQRAA